MMLEDPVRKPATPHTRPAPRSSAELLGGGPASSEDDRDGPQPRVAPAQPGRPDPPFAEGDHVSTRVGRRLDREALLGEDPAGHVRQGWAEVGRVVGTKA